MAAAKSILIILAAFAPLIVALVKAWLDGRPARKVKEARRENAQISRDVRSGDAAAVNRRLRKWLEEAGP